MIIKALTIAYILWMVVVYMRITPKIMAVAYMCMMVRCFKLKVMCRFMIMYRQQWVQD